MQLTLKAARVNRGLTQKQAAELLGISSVTLIKWEHGVTMPRQKSIEAICRLYGVSYDDIIFLPRN